MSPQPEPQGFPRIAHSTLNVLCTGQLVAKLRGTLIAITCRKCGQTCGVILPELFYQFFPGEQQRLKRR